MNSLIVGSAIIIVAAAIVIIVLVTKDNDDTTTSSLMSSPPHSFRDPPSVEEAKEAAQKASAEKEVEMEGGAKMEKEVERVMAPPPTPAFTFQAIHPKVEEIDVASILEDEDDELDSATEDDYVVPVPEVVAAFTREVLQLEETRPRKYRPRRRM